MSKYIIEIEDVPFSKVRFDADNGAQNINLYRAKGFNALVFDKNGLDKLTPLNKALDESYQQGLDDAWNATKQLIAKWVNGDDDVFGDKSIDEFIETFSASEAIAKLREYEQQKADEIKVGDEVEAYSGRAIVFGTFTDAKGGKFCRYWYPSDDSFNKGKTENLKKTGRHFPQVAELLNAMKEGAE